MIACNEQILALSDSRRSIPSMARSVPNNNSALNLGLQRFVPLRHIGVSFFINLISQQGGGI